MDGFEAKLARIAYSVNVEGRGKDIVDLPTDDEERAFVLTVASAFYFALNTCLKCVEIVEER